MSVASILYNVILKRSGTMATVAVIGAVFLERSIDWAATKIYYSHNQGKVWEDVRERLEAAKKNN